MSDEFQTSNWIAAGLSWAATLIVPLWIRRHYKAMDDIRRDIQQMKTDVGFIKGRFQERDFHGRHSTFPGDDE